MEGYPHSYSFAAIGTGWEICSTRPLDADVREAVAQLIDGYDRTYSRFRTDSQVSRLAAEGGTAELPGHAGELCSLYRSLYELTHGRFSPFVGRALSVLGYDSGYSLVPSGGFEPAVPWDPPLDWSGTRLSLPAGVQLDIGAAGKGQLVDLVGALLEERGHAEFVVDASGDLLHRGGIPLRVALEHPYDSTRAIGVLEAVDTALCASAVNRRAWGDGLHHVLDARTGVPVKTTAATWVLAGTAMLADALATALFVAEPEDLSGFHAFSHVRMGTSGAADFSGALKGELFG